MGNKVLNVEDEVSKKIKDYDSSIRNSLNEMKLPHTIDHNINLNPKHFSKNIKNCKILIIGENNTGRTSLVEHLSVIYFILLI